MNYPTFFMKIKAVFNLLLIISIAIPSILLLSIVLILFRVLQALQCETFCETLKRLKHLLTLLFYSIKIIFTKNRKDYAIVYCLVRKMQFGKYKNDLI